MKSALTILLTLFAQTAMANTLPPQVQAYVDYLAQSCDVMDGEFTSGDGLITRADLDQDGSDDVIVDGTYATCSSSPTLYCAEDVGCEVVTFVGEARHGLIVLDWELADINGQTGLRVKQSGLLLNLPQDKVSDLIWDAATSAYIVAAY
jgi:hypothetical protein